jgi:hypothetical protein
MKISDLSPEELKKYNAQSQKRSRERKQAKAEADRLASIIPKARQYVMPDAQRKKLEINAAQIMSAIKIELPQLSERDLEIIDGVSAVVTGFENSYSQNVHEPEGVLIGGHFCDAMASSCIEYVHRHPRLLEESKTFSELYKKQFLPLVSKWCRKNITAAPEYVLEINQELRGEYKLPEPKIEPEPERLPEPQEPPMTIESMRGKLSEQLLNDYSQFENSRPDMAQEARRYLDGEKQGRNRT